MTLRQYDRELDMCGTLVLHGNVFEHGNQGAREPTTGEDRCKESVSA